MNRINRRGFLSALAAGLSAQTAPETAGADVTLRIAPVELEIAPRRIIKTIGYNGSVPGPLLRWREGRQVTVDIHNDTSTAEVVHWHGLFTPTESDGAMEEGTPMVPAHGSRRYTFVPRPSGTRWYHTHIPAGRNLKRSTYTGQFGFLYIEPAGDPGRYDAEVFLALHGWEPYLGTMGTDEGSLDVIYQSYSVNGHSLGYGDPVRVKEGQRIMFRILNASATMVHRLAFAGHQFEVVALDGNPVPAPRVVDLLELGPAERIDALVTMNQPGVWILGEMDEHVRNAGLGVVVEYANRSGPPRWSAPSGAAWDYAIFGRNAAPSARNAELAPLVFKRKFAGNRWVDYWTINGKSYPKTDPVQVRAGQWYRLRFDNQSNEAHPVHLHRHSFELTKLAGKPTSGIVKDVVMVPANSQVEVDFRADNPGASLLHCHMQIHMDYGFMTLVQYVG
ncbi:MAG: multicopper oxidase family protein [Bryobacteraceae bacterium]